MTWQEPEKRSCKIPKKTGSQKKLDINTRVILKPDAFERFSLLLSTS